MGEKKLKSSNIKKIFYSYRWVTFFSVSLGGLLGFFCSFLLGVSPGNITIVSTALVAALLSYLGTMASHENRIRERREYAIRDFQECGWGFMNSMRSFCMDGVNYFPMKKDLTNQVHVIEKEIEYLVNQRVEARKEFDENATEEKYKVFEYALNLEKEYRATRFGEYDKARGALNEMNRKFLNEEAECIMRGERFEDQCNVLKTFLKNDNDSFESIVESVNGSVHGAKSFGKDLRDKKVLEVDKNKLGFADENIQSIRPKMKEIQLSEFLGMNDMLGEYQKNKKYIFSSICFLAMFCISYLVFFSGL